MQDPNQDQEQQVPNNEGKRIETIIPTWIEPYVIEVKELKYGDVVYTYIVVDAEISKRMTTPRIFTIFRGGVMAVSSNYPEEYREIGLIHEIREFTELQGEGEMACLDALKAELETMGKAGIEPEKYNRFRLEFFEGLIAYYEGKERDEIEDEFLKKIRHSYEHLKGLLSK